MMICFDTDNSRFNFRSVAVIIQDGHVLIHKAIEDSFWVLPGGRVEFFETSDKAIEREISEELGLKCKVVRQLWHVENFFEFGSKKLHEIANYFLTSFNSEPNIETEVDFKGIETSTNLLFRWVPIDNIENYNLKPEFLIKQLANVPNSIECIKINELNV